MAVGVACGEVGAKSAPVRPGRTRVARSRALKWGLAAVLLAAELALVVPHLSFGSAATPGVSWRLLGLAVAFEVLSLIAFSRMRRRLLLAGGARIGAARMGALTLASNAVSVTAPAGTAVSAAYLFQQLRRVGANSTVAVWALAAGSVVSGLAFTAVTIVGSMLDGDVGVAELVGAAGAGGVAGVAMVAVLAWITRHPEPLLAATTRAARRLPARWVGPDAARVTGALDRVLGQLLAIRPRVRDWALALGLSVLNWSCDLACFVLCCYAVGARGLGLGAAVLAYVAGLATIGISLTPGGLGSVEAGMLLGLAHGGVAAPVALAGVVAYRLIAYVLMGAVGWTVWAALRHAWAHRPEQVPPDLSPVLGEDPVPDLAPLSDRTPVLDRTPAPAAEATSSGFGLAEPAPAV